MGAKVLLLGRKRKAGSVEQKMGAILDFTGNYVFHLCLELYIISLFLLNWKEYFVVNRCFRVTWIQLVTMRTLQSFVGRLDG